MQLYRMANSPNVVHTEMEVSSLLCWNTSSFPSEKTRRGQSVYRGSLCSVVCVVVFILWMQNTYMGGVSKRLIILSNSVETDVLFWPEQIKNVSISPKSLQMPTSFASDERDKVLLSLLLPFNTCQAVK